MKTWEMGEVFSVASDNSEVVVDCGCSNQAVGHIERSTNLLATGIQFSPCLSNSRINSEDSIFKPPRNRFRNECLKAISAGTRWEQLNCLVHLAQ